MKSFLVNHSQQKIFWMTYLGSSRINGPLHPLRERMGNVPSTMLLFKRNHFIPRSRAERSLSRAPRQARKTSPHVSR